MQKFRRSCAPENFNVLPSQAATDFQLEEEIDSEDDGIIKRLEMVLGRKNLLYLGMKRHWHARVDC